MLDIRHDNLSHFIGATVDPPCIVSEFYPRGSLQVSLISSVSISLLLFPLASEARWSNVQCAGLKQSGLLPWPELFVL